MDKSLYLLATFDPETEQALADVYSVLQNRGFTGRQTKGIPYHFTLGDYRVEHEPDLLDKLQAVCAGTALFEIRLDHLGLFGTTCLFAEPNMNFELLTLQHSFFEGCGYGYHPWTAHATLLLDEPAEILRALPIAAQAFAPRKAVVNAVCLYEFFPARFIARCPLTGADEPPQPIRV